jgi:FkbM family methyltransferase
MGYYTLLLAKLNAIVYSFEPEPANFALLKRNVELNNFTNVTLYNKAASDTNGKAKLVLADYGTGQHTLESSKFGTRTIDVETTTIDLQDIAFAKIDVEGAELLVLKGMKALPKKMLIEFNTDNLKEHGTTPTEFFNFVKNYSIKQATKNGLVEVDYEKLVENKMATNLFLY